MVSLLYSAGLRVGEVCNLRYCDIERKNMRIHVAHSRIVLTVMPSFHGTLLISLPNTGLHTIDQPGAFPETDRSFPSH